ncbi:hypothetical protein [Ornithinimicrobium sp. Y1694]|uniref:hypothetical protein n=1 Tax=Ornithinimicrobium sp. Y1694 TaxID=3418590 RepID=UPI003CFB5D11
MTTNLPTVRFLRVLSHRSRQPVALAVVDGRFLVRWTLPGGWTCECDQPGDDLCTHMAAVDDLLDPRVTGETL